MINGPFLFKDKRSRAEYDAGMALTIERGRLMMHESGTYVRFTPAGADLLRDDRGMVQSELSGSS